MITDAGTLERLLYLRMLLREAQHRAQDPTPVGRHSACILLDGACEHALLLALGKLGEAPARDFHKSYGKASEILAEKWSSDGWSGIERLHGTRTEAQHRGTVPDAREFARWSADAERFINSLVAATFGVDLQSVSTAQAVETPTVRAKLLDAESALLDDRFRQSFTITMEAFDEARRLWARQRGPALSASRRPARMQDLTADYVQRALERSEDFAAVQPFASDLGEYIWLKDLRRHVNHDVFTRQDVERALAFVIEWVLRWEAFAHRYTADRFDALWRSQRPQTTEDADVHPYAGNVDVIAHEHRAADESQYFSVSVTVRDVPEREWQLWIQALEQTVTEHWQGSGLGNDDALYPWVAPSGVVTLQGVREEALAQRFVELVQYAVADAHELWRTAVEDIAAAERERQNREPAFVSAIQSILFEGRPLARSTSMQLHRGRPRDDPFVWLSVHAELDVRADENLRHELWQALNRTGQLGPGGGGPLSLEREELVAPATMTAEELAALLRGAVEAIHDRRQAARAADLDDEQQRQRIESAARARLER